MYQVIKTLKGDKGRIHLRLQLVHVAEKFPVLIRFSTVTFNSRLVFVALRNTGTSVMAHKRLDSTLKGRNAYVSVCELAGCKSCMVETVAPM